MLAMSCETLQPSAQHRWRRARFQRRMRASASAMALMSCSVSPLVYRRARVRESGGASTDAYLSAQPNEVVNDRAGAGDSDDDAYPELELASLVAAIRSAAALSSGQTHPPYKLGPAAVLGLLPAGELRPKQRALGGSATLTNGSGRRRRPHAMSYSRASSSCTGWLWTARSDENTWRQFVLGRLHRQCRLHRQVGVAVCFRRASHLSLFGSLQSVGGCIGDIAPRLRPGARASRSRSRRSWVWGGPFVGRCIVVLLIV